MSIFDWLQPTPKPPREQMTIAKFQKEYSGEEFVSALRARGFDDHLIEEILDVISMHCPKCWEPLGDTSICYCDFSTGPDF